MNREDAVKKGFLPFDKLGNDYRFVEGNGKEYLVKLSTGELVPCSTLFDDDGTKRIRMKPRVPSGKDMADALTNFVNNYSYEGEEFSAAMMAQHRTLQQRVFKLFVSLLKKWALAYEQDRFDERNAKTCELSKEIVSAFGEDLEYIPFI